MSKSAPTSEAAGSATAKKRNRSHYVRITALFGAAITAMTFFGLNEPVKALTHDAGWPGLIVFLVVCLILFASLYLGLYRLLSSAISLVRNIPRRPWTWRSRPRRWRIADFRWSEHGWTERVHTITRRRKETYITPSRPAAARSSPGDSAGPSAKPILIVFLDDAYGLKVAGRVPGMLYCDDDDPKDVVDTATQMIAAANKLGNDAHKVCVVIVPSRMADSKHAGGIFERAVERVAEAVGAMDPKLAPEPRWAIRIDSCLRTHFHQELTAIEQALAAKLGVRFDYRVFAPCNVGEERVTNFGVQFYRDHLDESYRPMADDTEYSSRPGFEYHESNLAL
jgi:hypothetical protein